MGEPKIPIPYDKIADFCERLPICRLALFGSVLRDDFSPDSDVDVLVEFLPDSGVTFFDLVTIKHELTLILGRQIDLLTPGALSRYFRQQVLNTAETIYERN
jgi:hypothetical protein